MKKLFVAFIFLPLYLYASHINYEAKIYTVIFSSLFPHKHKILVWSDSKRKEEVLSHVPNVLIVVERKNADILLLTKKTDIQAPQMKFVTSYKLLKHYKESAIGGFYWQKGRPNILFLKQNLQKYHLQLPSSLQEYEVDGL